MWSQKSKISRRKGLSLVQASKARKNPVAQRAKQIGAINSGKMKNELKFYDVAVAPTLVAGSSAWDGGNWVCIPVRGDDAVDRDGRSITLKSILLRYTWNLQTTSIGGSNARIVIIYDKAPNAAAAVSVTDVFQNNLQNSPLRLDYKDRFLCIADVYTDVISANGNFSVSGQIYRRLPNLQMEFNGNTVGSPTDVTTGLLMVYTAQNGYIATAAPFLNYRVRTRFVDN